CWASSTARSASWIADRPDCAWAVTANPKVHTKAYRLLRKYAKLGSFIGECRVRKVAAIVGTLGHPCNGWRGSHTDWGSSFNGYRLLPEADDREECLGHVPDHRGAGLHQDRGKALPARQHRAAAGHGQEDRVLADGRGPGAAVRARPRAEHGHRRRRRRPLPR